MTHEKFTIRRTGKPSLRFTGELVCNASDHGYDYYRDECATLALYRTAGGKWVAVSHHETRTMAPDYHGAKVCDNVEQVHEFFGYTPEAQELYAMAGIEPVEYVDVEYYIDEVKEVAA